MSEKVLIVDDEPDVVGALQAGLRREPYEILAAHSAAEAKEILAREPIGVVVIDERLPGKSGSALAQELAVEHPHVPRIMLTGHADLTLALRSINEGAVFKFLQKPPNIRELAATIALGFELRAKERAKEELLDLSRRQASLVERLEATKEGSVPNGKPKKAPDVDPVSFLPAREAELLSRREKEILRHLTTGQKPQEIAAALFISVHTARNHIKAIYQKLGVHSQGELIAKVLRAPGRGHDASTSPGSR